MHSLSQLQIGAYIIIHNLGLLHSTLASEECCHGLEITQIKLLDIPPNAQMRTHTHSSQYLTTGNMEFPRRAITSHYSVPFLAHIP